LENWAGLKGNAGERALEFRHLVLKTIKTVGTGLGVTNAAAVAGGAIFYGGLQEQRTGKPITPTNAAQELRKLQADPLAYLQSNYTNAIAGLNVGEMNMVALRRAFFESEFDTRLNGDGPLLGLSQLGIPERTSTAVYASATSMATLYSDFLSMIDDAKVASATSAAYDTLIVAQKSWFALSRSTNYAAGGSANAQKEIVNALQSRGISRIIVGKSLADFGGTNVDGALLFQASDEFGLMQVRQMNAAPVHTYTSANGTNTVFAASWGGFECPRLDSALILKLPTA
jgi:hypothetical protein